MATGGRTGSGEGLTVPDRHGPYRNVRFLLEIDEIAIAGFSECHVPASATDVIGYREGNDPPTVRKLWGLNRYDRLVLEKGVTDDSMELFEWRKLVEQGKVDDARRPVAVVVLDEEGNSGPRWELTDCWPVRYEAPNLHATGKDVAIERLELATEGVERTT